jgi:hypothetical protein
LLIAATLVVLAMQVDTPTTPPSVGNASQQDDTRRYARDGVVFEYPSYLSPRPRYPNELVGGTGRTGPISSVRATRISSEVLIANGSPAGYIDGFSVEFPGPFTLATPTATTSVGSATITRKQYTYASAEDAPQSLVRVLALVSIDTNHVLLEVSGAMSDDFEAATNAVLHSVTF